MTETRWILSGQRISRPIATCTDRLHTDFGDENWRQDSPGLKHIYPLEMHELLLIINIKIFPSSPTFKKIMVSLRKVLARWENLAISHQN